ncbi:unnamed protein product [Effrenium voratum]|nr:unnamed protein product [Effrenium voratum]
MVRYRMQQVTRSVTALAEGNRKDLAVTLLELGRQRRSQVDAVGLNSAISACAGGPWEHRAQARSLDLALERVSLRRAMMILHSFAQFGGCLGERLADVLAVESLASFVKSRVRQQRSVSIFQQRLLHGEHIIADGEMWEELGRPQEIQIMFALHVHDFASELLAAAYAGDQEVALQALRQLQDPNCTDFLGQAPLWKACAAGHASLAELLYKADADLEHCDQLGKTALVAASENNHLEAARCLLEARANVNSADSEGLSPLLWATQNGHLQVMQLLLQAKADKDASNGRLETPLFLVATHGYATAVRVLTEAGADKDKADESGLTPLHVAAENGHLESVQVLIEAKASINTAAKTGATPLFLAAKRGHLQVVSLLVGSGAEKDEAAEGVTPLFAAAYFGRFEVARFLAQAGAKRHRPGAALRLQHLWSSDY